MAADGGPVPAADLLADVEAALADLAEASGLRFAPVVTTDERPAADRDVAVRDADGGWRWAPVLVAWADPHEAGLPLRDVDRGIGAPVAIGPSGARVYVTGQVVLNRRRTDLVAGRDDRATSWGATVLHELAHVVGLDHVDDPAQLMATYPGQGPVELADGDRAGLAAVGADGGCLEVPPARPVQVPAPTP
ncbi:matrixin family metalloprotease [Nitriliruptoraceae bacterium ZYF776]|nr:matrixin family metalloprotease [Profundirhabdus halotolerans]